MFVAAYKQTSAPRVSTATLESGNRVITGIINNARLLNCLFKVYVFMVCRTWWRGVGEEWVYLICIHFGIVRIFYDALCKRFGDVAVRAPSLVAADRKYDSFNYYFQKQPHEDGSKAEMKPTQRKGLNV